MSWATSTSKFNEQVPLFRSIHRFRSCAWCLSTSSRPGMSFSNTSGTVRSGGPHDVVQLLRGRFRVFQADLHACSRLSRSRYLQWKAKCPVDFLELHCCCLVVVLHCNQRMLRKQPEDMQITIPRSYEYSSLRQSSVQSTVCVARIHLRDPEKVPDLRSGYILRAVDVDNQKRNSNLKPTASSFTHSAIYSFQPGPLN